VFLHVDLRIDGLIDAVACYWVQGCASECRMASEWYKAARDCRSQAGKKFFFTSDAGLRQTQAVRDAAMRRPTPLFQEGSERQGE